MGRAKLSEKFPNASKEALRLLEGMLEFNPYFRYNLQECLEHPYFNDVRQSDKETVADKEIRLEIQDLNLGEKGNEKEDQSVLRELILKEVAYFKEMRAQGKTYL